MTCLMGLGVAVAVAAYAKLEAEPEPGCWDEGGFAPERVGMGMFPGSWGMRAD